LPATSENAKRVSANTTELEVLTGYGRKTSKNCKHYLLTPWSRVLLEKLTASAASQEIPRIFGT